MGETGAEKHIYAQKPPYAEYVAARQICEKVGGRVGQVTNECGQEWTRTTHLTIVVAFLRVTLFVALHHHAVRVPPYSLPTCRRIGVWSICARK